MGSNEEERELKYKRRQKIVKACIACLGSFLISMFGGLILAFWELKYHPTNSQLWMVPFGLVVFATPVIAWFSVFISDISTPEGVDASSPKHPAALQDTAIRDPERDDRKVSA
ncbi:hypothetical protein RJ639_009884 [Escallonia herrerae]|uniref:Uncharacterized protein n=1 Tax=Escallonia herrerae TaxID=1293975 RepID=A0AA88VUD7_9ASTE|nr:hypothetical protein RJ639_009884 [Escallonia herrerae]